MDEPARKFTRSGQMVRTLKEHLLYSDKKARDFLFDAIEDLIREAQQAGHPLMVSRLLREAAQRARETARQAGFEFRNWNTTTVAVINTMLGAGVPQRDVRVELPEQRVRQGRVVARRDVAKPADHVLQKVRFGDVRISFQQPGYRRSLGRDGSWNRRSARAEQHLRPQHSERAVVLEPSARITRSTLARRGPLSVPRAPECAPLSLRARERQAIAGALCAPPAIKPVPPPCWALAASACATA